MPNGCWLWRGCTNNEFYGQYRVGGKTELAHRVVYEKYKKKIEPGKILDHFKAKEGCPRYCVNPDHLEEVSHAVNIQRGKLGKFTQEDIEEARKLYDTGKYTNIEIAGKYGISLGYFCNLMKRRVRN